VAEPGPELRLGLMSQLFDITERGFQIQFPSYSEMDKWYKEVLEVLNKMDRLYRILSPLPGTESLSIPHYVRCSPQFSDSSNRPRNILLPHATYLL
jgi:hypothetical protein